MESKAGESTSGSASAPVSSAASTLNGKGLSGAEGIAEAARSAAQSAQQAVMRARDRIVGQSQAAAQEVNRQAHEKPWMFIGFTALAASLVGFLAGRKSRS